MILRASGIQNAAICNLTLNEGTELSVLVFYVLHTSALNLVICSVKAGIFVRFIWHGACICHPGQDTGAFALAQALKANGEAAVSTLNLTSNFLTKYGQVCQHSHLLSLHCYLFVSCFGNSLFGPQTRLFQFWINNLHNQSLVFVDVSCQCSFHSGFPFMFPFWFCNYLVHAGRPHWSEGSCEWNERRKGSQYIFLDSMQLTIASWLIQTSTKRF